MRASIARFRRRRCNLVSYVYIQIYIAPFFVSPPAPPMHSRPNTPRLVRPQRRPGCVRSTPESSRGQRARRGTFPQGASKPPTLRATPGPRVTPGTPAGGSVGLPQSTNPPADPTWRTKWVSGFDLSMGLFGARNSVSFDLGHTLTLLLECNSTRTPEKMCAPIIYI